MIQEQKREAVESSDSTSEGDPQGHVEYAHLSRLLEQERISARTLADLVSQIQAETDNPIPLSKAAFSSLPLEVGSAYLAPDATVVVVDSAGDKQSRPLRQLPLEIAVVVVQESLAELRRILLEKQTLLARRVKAIDRIAGELEGAKRSFSQGSDDDCRKEPPAETSEAVVEQAAPPAESPPEGEKDDLDFKFNGTFEEQRQALDGHQFPFTNAGQTRKRGGH